MRDTSQLEIRRDYYGVLDSTYEVVPTTWVEVCEKVNAHNNLFREGGSDYLLRVFCPYEGELFVHR